MKLLAIPTLALALAGCAMTPQQQDEFRANFMGGLAAGAMIEQSRQPMYQPQPYPMPLFSTRCTSSWVGNVQYTNCN